METIAMVLFTNIGTQFFKKYVYPKYGATGVQAVLFIVSLFVSGVMLVKESNFAVKKFFEVGSAVFMVAITTYEVLWKKFTMFK